MSRLKGPDIDNNTRLGLVRGLCPWVIGRLIELIKTRIGQDALRELSELPDDMTLGEVCNQYKIPFDGLLEWIA